MPTASELRELDDEELDNRLSEYRREMLNLRFQLATGQLDNVVRLSVVRKDVARVLTVLRDREIALAEGRHAGPVVATRPPRRRPTPGAEPEDLAIEGLDTEDAVLDDLDVADTVTEDTVAEEDAVAEEEDSEDAVEEPAAPRRRGRRAKVVDEAPEPDDGDAHQPAGDADEEEQ
jgi:large subunit ribosomal protein L29